MIIGMAPMALGLGEGGEQNAPLGRAVVGGLIFATFATLIFVPVVFSMVHKKQSAQPAQTAELAHALCRKRSGFAQEAEAVWRARHLCRSLYRGVLHCLA
jgi:hypothetical protein